MDNSTKHNVTFDKVTWLKNFESFLADEYDKAISAADWSLSLQDFVQHLWGYKSMFKSSKNFSCLDSWTWYAALDFIDQYIAKAQMRIELNTPVPTRTQKFQTIDWFLRMEVPKHLWPNELLDFYYDEY